MERLIHWIGDLLSVDMSFFPRPPGPCHVCGSRIRPSLKWRRQWWYCLVMTWWIWLDWFDLSFGPWQRFPFWVWLGFKDRASEESWFAFHSRTRDFFWYAGEYRGKRLHTEKLPDCYFLEPDEAWLLEIGPLTIRKYSDLEDHEPSISLKAFGHRWHTKEPE